MTRDVEFYRRGFIERNRAVIATAISAVENDREDGRAVLSALADLTGRAHIVGVTGSPGVGKSTLVSALAAQLRADDRSVAILAVDPSSPFGGGAVLGDRIRMAQHALDADVYIRSLASRGQIGGLSQSTAQAIDVLDGAGFDVVIVETVGTGQAETDIMHLVDTVAVVIAPGFGDEVQAVKAGILEIADVFVVNKADNPQAERTRRALEEAIRDTGDTDWHQLIVATVATEGSGLEELLGVLDRHAVVARRASDAPSRRARRQVAAIVARFVADSIIEGDDPEIEDTVEELRTGRIGSDEATAAVMNALLIKATPDVPKE